MGALKNNEYKTIIWGAKNNFITGLDPLGLQITSEATYAALLPELQTLQIELDIMDSIAGFWIFTLKIFETQISKHKTTSLEKQSC